MQDIEILEIISASRRPLRTSCGVFCDWFIGSQRLCLPAFRAALLQYCVGDDL